MAKPYISLFRLTPTSIVEGDQSLLRWLVTFADTVEIQPINRHTHLGTFFVNPTTTTTYTITATNAEGTTVREATLTVVPKEAPIPGGAITFANITPNPVEPGRSITISTRATNTGNTSKQFILNIWSSTHGNYWNEWTMLVPGGSMSFNRGVTNIVKEERFEVLLWRWDISDSTLIATEYRTVFLTELPPEPEECPDFWTDPVGAVLCWIISGLEIIWGFSLNLVKDTVLWIQTFQQSITAEIYKLFQDPIKYIQDAVSSIIPNLSDWWEGVISGIGSWWDDTKAGIGDWWSSVSKAVGDWIDSSFSNIGSWWESVRSSVVSWVTDRWTDATSFWNDVTSNIGKWWDDTKASIWNGLQSTVKGLEGWIDSTKAGIGDWWNGVSTGIGEWWSGTVKDLGEAWEDFASGVGETWDGMIIVLGDVINTEIKKVEDWVLNIIPGIVEAMFDWAKPVIQPIIDAAGWLGEITGIVTGKKPEDPVITDAKDKIKEHQDAIKDLVDELRT